MSFSHILPRRPWQLFLALVLSFALPACVQQVRLISDYDESIDQGVTSIQKKVEVILTKIERWRTDPSKAYVAQDYTAIREDLDLLITRAQAAEKSDLTTKQLYTLGYALVENPPVAPPELGLGPPQPQLSLEARNRYKEALTAADIQDLRKLIDADFRAILKLELAKKRGTDVSKGQ